MSPNQLKIELDKNDCTYRPGDQITGKIIVNLGEDTDINEVWVACAWKTHGRGSPDGNIAGDKTLSDVKMRCKTGGHIEFPFEFLAPNTPLTIRGHNVNVDWYIYAVVELHGSHKIRAQRDFLLLNRTPSDTASRISTSVSFGQNLATASLTQEMDSSDSSPLKPDVKVNKLVWIGTIIVCLSLFLLLPFLLPETPIKGIYVFLFTISCVVFLGLWISFSLFVKPLITWLINQKILVTKLYIQDTVSQDGTLRCRIQLKAKNEADLKNINGEFFVQESVSMPFQSRTGWITSTIHKQSFVEDVAGQIISRRPVIFEWRIPVPPDVPPIFGAQNNYIRWYVKVKLPVQSWLAWEKTIQIRAWG